MSSLDQLRAVQNERRYPDRVEDAADVDVEVHTHVIAQGARAHAQSKDAFERHPIVLRHVGTSYLEQLSLGRLAPSTHHLLDVLLLLAARGKPRELGRAHQARRGVDQHEPVRALRIGGGEEHGERTALTESANDGPVRAGSVHHRPDVVHARLERRVAGDAVGHARAALVEQKQTPQLHQPDEEAHNRRVLPAQLDVVREARDPDEVELSFADHLVCDVDFAAHRILRFRLHRHSLARDRFPCGVSNAAERPYSLDAHSSRVTR